MAMGWIITVKDKKTGRVVGTKGAYARKADAFREAQVLANRNGSAATVSVKYGQASASKPGTHAAATRKNTARPKRAAPKKAPKQKGYGAQQKAAPKRRKNPGEALAAKYAGKASAAASRAARAAGQQMLIQGKRAARHVGAKAARAGSGYLSEKAQALEAQRNPTRRNPIAGNVSGFLMYLTGALTQYDAKENKKHYSLYRLGHLFGAVDKIRADMAGRGSASDQASLEMLKQSIGTHFILNGMPPARKTIKAIDAFIATGKAPKYPTSKA